MLSSLYMALRQRAVRRIHSRLRSSALHSGSFANVRQEWIFAGFFADRKVGPVRVGEPVALHAFTDASEVVIDRREKSVSGGLVQEQGQRLSPAGDTAFELGVGFSKCSGLKICFSEIEAADPRIEQTVAFFETGNRLTGITGLKGNFAFDELAIGLRFGL